MMNQINYDGMVFRLEVNLGPGDVDQETLFFYHQKDEYLWGHYEGGNVNTGILIGKVLPDYSLEFDYCHYDLQGIFKKGRCHSRPSLDDGQITLHERWEWTDGEKGEGTSILKEIKRK